MKKKVLITSLIVVLILVVALFTLGGGFMEKKYLEPWSKNYYQKFDDPRVQIIAHGILAANGHNMQPWKIKLDEKDEMSFLLFADSDRLSPEVDPYARQTTLTQGTFLEYVRIAAEKLGYITQINLFPEGEYDQQGTKESMDAKPVARVTLVKGISSNNPLYDMMFVPDTIRVAYKDIKLTQEQIMQLQGLNTYKDIELTIYQDQQNLQKLSKFTMDGVAIEAGIPKISAATMKIFRANESEKNKYRYGFSLEGQGLNRGMIILLQSIMALFPSLNNDKSSTDMYIKQTKIAVDNTPAYALIITKDNSRTAQVKAGMLYSRFQLACENMGFFIQPLSQVLQEYPEMNELYKRIHKDYAGGSKTIQMFVRVGQPVKQVLPSMRRDVYDIIKY